MSAMESAAANTASRPTIHTAVRAPSGEPAVASADLKAKLKMLWKSVLYADRVPLQQLQVDPEKQDVPKVDFGTTGN